MINNPILDALYIDTQYSALVPTMTSNTLPSGVALASVEPTGLEAWRAFSNNSSNEWYDIIQSGTGWLQYKFTSNKVVISYKWRYGPLINNTTSFTLQGSNDGSTFTILDTQNGIFMAAGTFFNGQITSAGKYLYYRLNFTANSSNLASVTLFQMYGY